MEVRSVFSAIKRSRANDGFTLLEIVVSLGLFSLLVLVFASSVPLAKQATEANGQTAQAISLCQHKIDQCRARGGGGITYAELWETQVIDAIPATQPYSTYSFTEVDSVSTYLPKPSATLTVQDVPVTAGGTTVTVTRIVVTIKWSNLSYHSSQRTVSLTADIAHVD